MLFVFALLHVAFFVKAIT